LDGITILAFFIIALSVVGGIALAVTTAWLTRKMSRGRGWLVLLAALLPAIYFSYLISAGYVRNVYHAHRIEASNIDGNCTLPLGAGFTLSFFDEFPFGSSIGRGGSAEFRSVIVGLVQRIAVFDPFVVGQTGTDIWPTSPIDSFFALDLRSGELRKFRSEAEMRSFASYNGPLDDTDKAFFAAEDKQRSGLFWPIIAGAPLLAFASLCFKVVRKRARNSTNTTVSTKS
jgi:hypothetical protein